LTTPSQIFIGEIPKTQKSIVKKSTFKGQGFHAVGVKRGKLQNTFGARLQTQRSLGSSWHWNITIRPSGICELENFVVHLVVSQEH
jgi:hypothetical protein